jgi:hypothetical protein
VSESADLRVSDSDRERAVAEIREHYSAGRLNDEEMDARVQAALDARTQGELNAIRQDLPRLPVSPAQRKADLAERRGELRAQLLQESGGGVIVFAVCTVLWITGGASGFFWPVFVALVCVLPLIRTGWRLYGPAPDLDRVEADLASMRRRGEQHAARRERRAERRGR